MLVLSRKHELGQNTIRFRVPPSDCETVIDVVVTKIDSGRVKLGSIAPSDVAVNRLEVEARRTASPVPPRMRQRRPIGDGRV